MAVCKWQSADEVQELVNEFWRRVDERIYRVPNIAALTDTLDTDMRTIRRYIDRSLVEIDRQELERIADILTRCLRRIEAGLANALFDNVTYKGAALALKVGFNWRDQLDINTSTERRIVIAPAIDDSGDVGLLPAGALDE